MNISRKNISQATLFVAASFILSSCNRGYGCPSNFNLGDFLIDASTTIGQAVIQFLF